MLRIVQAVGMSHLTNVRTEKSVKEGGGTKGKEAPLLWMPRLGWSWYLGKPEGKRRVGRKRVSA